MIPEDQISADVGQVLTASLDHAEAIAQQAGIHNDVGQVFAPNPEEEQLKAAENQRRQIEGRAALGDNLMERAELNAQMGQPYFQGNVIGYKQDCSTPMNPLVEAGLQCRAAILDAFLKYRAIARNRPAGMDIDTHLATDERVLGARSRMERALLSAGLIEAGDLQFGMALTPIGLRVKTPTADILIPL